ncbi:hypothetical protein V8C86DRAFT_316651 [Haematococcus lacustris]
MLRCVELHCVAILRLAATSARPARQAASCMRGWLRSTVLRVCKLGWEVAAMERGCNVAAWLRCVKREWLPGCDVICRKRLAA